MGTTIEKDNFAVVHRIWMDGGWTVRSLRSSIQNIIKQTVHNLYQIGQDGNCSLQGNKKNYVAHVEETNMESC